MNPYFALSAIFALGLRGIEKKLELSVVPITQMTQEDKRSGKVRSPPCRWFTSSISQYLGFGWIGYDVASVARSCDDSYDATRKRSEGDPWG